jgi:hypothetical protein
MRLMVGVVMGRALDNGACLRRRGVCTLVLSLADAGFSSFMNIHEAVRW